MTTTKPKRFRKQCFNCKYAGNQFKFCQVTHLHCDHPDEDVRGETGWGTLREFWNVCDKWESKEEASRA